MSERRVVVTGMGVLSPVGNDLSTFWENLTHGKSGIGPITAFDTSEYSCTFGGEVRDFDVTNYLKTPKDGKRMDRYTQLSMAAAKLALDDSGLDVSSIDPYRIGVIAGSGIGGLGTLEDNHKKLLERNPSRVSPLTIPMMIANIASGQIAMEHGLCGPNMSIVTACATANNCIGEAWRMIKFGDADYFIAGGSEASIRPMGLSGFGNMKALSKRNDDPQRASRPFDVGRDGFVMGEGAGIMMLEELEAAKARGARIYCELAGYGVSADAYHLTSPQPEGHGASNCMNMALKHAKLNPEEVDYVNAHGTSTPVGDVCETLAIKRSLGDHAKKTIVSSTKSMTGHLLGAAGGVEFAACALAMRDGIIPPTINLEDQDPQCDLDYTPNKAREAKVDTALSNSFGFGGHNASLTLRRFED
ncbi:MAG: beta-ketoacyl-ACP synthase II [Verrucomicrobiaceae bacterium]|nr:beta-ketoacyl-ACP synthase II [Verrucomicrobiaceae bacterium]